VRARSVRRTHLESAVRSNIANSGGSFPDRNVQESKARVRSRREGEASLPTAQCDDDSGAREPTAAEAVAVNTVVAVAGEFVGCGVVAAVADGLQIECGFGWCRCCRCR